MPGPPVAVSGFFITLLCARESGITDSLGHQFDPVKSVPADNVFSSNKRTCPTCGLALEAQVNVCPRDGTLLTKNIQTDPVFDRYEFIESVGAGGMGVIYKARHVILNKMVAIKTLHTHMVTPDAVRRFQIEGKATSSLSHPSIINVQDFGVTQSGQAYMVMDFIDGETLGDVLNREPQLPMNRFFNIFIQVCDALDHAHTHHVLHRDIKPSNIMLRKNVRGEEEVRIMDFGIAKILSDTESGASNLTRTGDALGSPTYMSPEQARGEKTDYRSDLYSLGCVMYESLTGSPPFNGNTPLKTMMMHLEQAPLSLREASMGRVVDPDVEKIVLSLLEKNPGNRPQSMMEVKEILTELSRPTATGSTLKRPGITRSVGNKTKARPIFIFSLLFTVCAFLIGVAINIFIQQPALLRDKKLPADTPNSMDQSRRSADTAALDTYPVSLGKNGARKIIRDRLKNGERKIDLTQLDGVVDPLTDEDLIAFESATSQTVEVELQDADIDDRGLDHLGGMKLESLDIARTNVHDLSGLANMKTLVTLNIGGLDLSDKGYQNLKTLSGLRTLKCDKAKHLNFERLAELSNLTDLELNNIHLTLPDLKGIARLKNLRTLSLNSTSLQELGPLKGLAQLVDFSCIDNLLDKKSFELIGRFTKIAKLNLSQTPLDDDDLKQLRKLTTMQYLTIHWTNVSLKAADELSNEMPVLYISYRMKNTRDSKLDIAKLSQMVADFETKKNWQGASDLLEQESYASNATSQEKAYFVDERADCLRKLNLPVVAGKIYADASRRMIESKMNDVLPLTFCKTAEVFEEIGSPEYVKKAIIARLSAAAVFNSDIATGSMSNNFELKRTANLAALQKDVQTAMRNGESTNALAELIPAVYRSDSQLPEQYKRVLTDSLNKALSERK